jgi:hypothetical protein
LEILDTIRLSEEATQLAEATFLKKQVSREQIEEKREQRGERREERGKRKDSVEEREQS